MSKAQIKKALKDLSREELIEVILELYSARKEAREYLEFWADPDIDKVLDKTKTDIVKIFFTSPERARKKPATTALKALISDFKSFGPGPEMLCDIYLTVLEQISRWAECRNGLGLKSMIGYMQNYLEITHTLIDESGLADVYGLRYDRMAMTTGRLIDVSERIRPGRRGYLRFIKW